MNNGLGNPKALVSMQRLFLGVEFLNLILKSPFIPFFSKNKKAHI
jgi:hypothetical protein